MQYCQPALTQIRNTLNKSFIISMYLNFGGNIKNDVHVTQKTAMTNSRTSFSELSASNVSLFRNEFEQCVNGVNKLPENTLLKIFSLLSKPDLENCQQVCQRWKQVTLNPSLWKTIEIQNLHTEEGLNLAMKKIWTFQKVKKISIDNTSDATTLLRQICRSLPDLEVLMVKHCRLSSATMRVVLKHCRHIRHLDLEGTTFNDFTFYEDLSKLRNLEVLNLNDNTDVTTKILIYIILNCRNLQEIHTNLINSKSTKKFTDDDCYFLLNNMSKQISGLSVDGANLSSTCFQKIIESEHLEHLGFHRAFNLDGKIVSNSRQFLKNLKTLRITFGHQIESRHFEDLFTHGKYELRQLEMIDFTACWQIADAALKAICECCPKLKNLIIKRCRSIADIGCLRGLKDLESLNIAFCPKIELKTWLPIQDSLRSLYIDRSDNFQRISEYLRTEVRDVNLHICNTV